MQQKTRHQQQQLPALLQAETPAASAAAAGAAVNGNQLSIFKSFRPPHSHLLPAFQTVTRHACTHTHIHTHVAMVHLFRLVLYSFHVHPLTKRGLCSIPFRGIRGLQSPLPSPSLRCPTLCASGLGMGGGSPYSNQLLAT